MVEAIDLELYLHAICLKLSSWPRNNITYVMSEAYSQFRSALKLLINFHWFVSLSYIISFLVKIFSVKIFRSRNNFNIHRKIIFINMHARTNQSEYSASFVSQVSSYGYTCHNITHISISINLCCLCLQKFFVFLFNFINRLWLRNTMYTMLHKPRLLFIYFSRVILNDTQNTFNLTLNLKITPEKIIIKLFLT